MMARVCVQFAAAQGVATRMPFSPTCRRTIWTQPQGTGDPEASGPKRTVTTLLEHPPLIDQRRQKIGAHVVNFSVISMPKERFSSPSPKLVLALVRVSIVLVSPILSSAEESFKFGGQIRPVDAMTLSGCIVSFRNQDFFVGDSDTSVVATVRANIFELVGNEIKKNYIVLAGGSVRIPFLIRVSKPGLYLVEFQTEVETLKVTSESVKAEQSKIGDRPLVWTDTSFVRVAQ